MPLTRLSVTLIVTDCGDFETESDPDFDEESEQERDLDWKFDSEDAPKKQTDEQSEKKTEKDPENFGSKEKANPDGRVTKVLNIPAEFVEMKAGSFGRQKSVSLTRLRDPEGHIMNSNHKYGDVKYWQCMTHFTSGCRVSAKTVGSTLEWISGAHHHVEKVRQNPRDNSERRMLNIPANLVPIKSKNSQPACPRLKDPEGFQLRIQKSVGDVKYWICPKQHHGCKVKAKTSGFNLEWISGQHHHEVKIHGNTRRIRDMHLAKKQATPGSNTQVWNVEATFVKGKIGGTLLKDPFGFLMNAGKKNRSQGSQLTGGRIYWRCKTHGRDGCKASAITQGMTLEQTSGKHCHENAPKIHGNTKCSDESEFIVHDDTPENV